MTVTPGECAQGPMPGVLPPPYAIATSTDKPPAYTDIYKSSTSDQVDTVQENVVRAHNVAETVTTTAATSTVPIAAAATSTVPATTIDQSSNHATVSPGGGIVVV